MLTETGKAAIIHPTGTGKSFIAFKLCEDNAEKRVLWLSPSEYIYKTQVENLKAVSNGYSPDNIAFCTYAKLMYMTADEISEFKPDYIILDEFHRCGAEMWGKGVDAVLSAFPKVPILGLSATNIRYLDNQRDMADELFDNNVASEMTLGEAIVRGILNPPKYVLSVFKYQDCLDKYAQRVRRAKSRAVRDKAENYLEALRRALDKADGLPEIFGRHILDKSGKYIVFCASVEHMDEMVSYASEWFGGIDSAPHIYRAYSDDPETSKAFANFKKDDSEHLKLLYCIDMLNEGVHVEDVSGVILLRPTVSPIIYKQQIGRALSASKTTNAVIFDIVMNIDNLYSIGTVQDEIRVMMTYYRERGLENEIVNDNFEVVDEVRDCIELFEKLNDTLGASWEFMFDEARKYYERNGNLEVPTKYKTESGYSLGYWLHTQRKVRRGEQFGILGKDRISKLDSIGMVWESNKDLSWKRYYAAAKEYFNEYGDLKVAASYKTKNGVKLGAWISNLRTYRKNGAQSYFLTDERVAALDKIGMVWSVPDLLWARNYSAAKSYYQSHGDLDVPSEYIAQDGTKLGLWISNMRGAANGGNRSYRLTDEQTADLNAIGMIWQTKNDRAWERGFSYAQEYFDNHGDLRVPTTFVTSDGYRLGGWICCQRGNASAMSEERKKRLDEIGMVWLKEKSWDKAYALAYAFYAEYGHLNIPYDYKVDGVWLNKWINEQKQKHAGRRGKRTLTDEQTALLENIGINWELGKESVKSSAWNKQFAEAEAFFEENGHLNVSAESGTACAKRLQLWLARQRKARKSGNLAQEQIDKLDRIGMAWEAVDAWEVGYAHAKDYAASHGDLIVPIKYVCADGYKLGNWVANQRSIRASNDKRRQISSERAARLERTGMVWNMSDYVWAQAYDKALKHFQQYGNMRIARGTKDADGLDLWSWINDQKKRYKQGKLSQDRVFKLAAIGVISLTELKITGEAKRVAGI